MDRPIVILGTPRSFTSLTAGIFRDHGVWFGRCKEYHEYTPTGSCENAKMKTLLKNFRKGAVSHGIIIDPVPNWKEKIEELKKEENYTSGAFAFKHSAVFYRTWEGMNPKYVCCRRPRGKVMRSGERTGMYRANQESWDAHQNAMDKLVDEGKAVNVYGEKYFDGDWSDLKKAFEFCGLEFKQEIADKLLNHKHKHF